MDRFLLTAAARAAARDSLRRRPAPPLTATSRQVEILRRWDKVRPRGGIAVVIDVIRFSTTLCALLRAGRRRILVARIPEDIQDLGAAAAASSDVFSELKFRSRGRRFDNSPHCALRESAPRRAAYVVTTSGSKALWACRGADRVLAGCFANFGSTLRALRRAQEKIWLVAAALPGTRGDLEDALCAEALRDALAGKTKAAREAAVREAVESVRNSRRIAEFLGSRPETGRQDLALCLALDRLPVVPEATFPAPAPPIAVDRQRRLAAQTRFARIREARQAPK